MTEAPRTDEGHWDRVRRRVLRWFLVDYGKRKGPMPTKPNVFAECSWCRAPIAGGKNFVTLSRKVQQIDKVVKSDPVLYLCSACAEALSAEAFEKALVTYFQKPVTKCAWCLTPIYERTTHVVIERSTEYGEGNSVTVTDSQTFLSLCMRCAYKLPTVALE